MVRAQPGARQIFVGGHRRSGTSLFAAALGNHPEIFQYPDDSKFFQHVYHSAVIGNRDDTLTGIRKVLIYLSEVVEKYHLEIDINPDQITADISDELVEPFEWDDAYKALIGMVQQLFQVDERGLTWKWTLQKTTSSEIYAPSIFSRFPDCIMFCVVRDPRDNFASLVRGFGQKYQYFKDSRTRQHLMFSLLSRGFCGARTALINSVSYGSKRFRVIRYEDLVSEPQAVLEDCCDALSLNFSDATLQPSVAGKSWTANSFSSGISKAFDPCRIGSWRTVLKPSEAALIEGWYGAELFEYFGYPVYSSSAEISSAMAEFYLWFNHESGLNG